MGRRSGEPRATPVLYLRDGDALVVCASNAGAERTPAWWLNLREAGEGTAVVGSERTRVRPRVLEGAERERLWRAFAEMYPQLDIYTEFTRATVPPGCIGARDHGGAAMSPTQQERTRGHHHLPGQRRPVSSSPRTATRRPRSMRSSPRPG